MVGLLHIAIRLQRADSRIGQNLPGLLLLLGFLFSAGVQPCAAVVAPPRCAPDRILIKPKSHVSAEALNAFHQTQGTCLRREFRIGVQEVGVPTGQSIPELLQRFRDSGLVEYAEPDHFVRSAATPNDPYFLAGSQWPLLNTGQNDGTPGADIHAVSGWEAQTSASNIVVAVLDTGIRCTHEDLVDNLWVNTNDNSYGFNAFANNNDPLDDNGHGTHVAGILGAVGDNGIGIAGVAWRVQIMAAKCLDQEGNGTDSSVIACLEFAQTNGARIINTSFNSSAFSESVSNALLRIRDAGIIVVASAGNQGSDIDLSPTYPACYDIDNIVSVGNTDSDDCVGWQSNFGLSNVDIMAPGDAVFSTSFEADDAYLIPDYPLPSGTSFAAAHVSGALALILEKFPGEDYRTSIRRLLLAVDQVPGVEGKCLTEGRLNLAHAFNPPVRLNLNATEESVGLTVSTAPLKSCVIESSPDLTHWTPVHTNTTSILGTFEFTDGPATNSCLRFYRAISLP